MKYRYLKFKIDIIEHQHLSLTVMAVI